MFRANAVWLYGALVRSAQMAGGLEYLLRQAVAVRDRARQFGRPIGAFQVIQQNLAVLAGHTAAAGTAAADARSAPPSAATPRFEIAVAKVRVGEAAGIGARHRASDARRDRLHLRARAALRDAPALVVARRVRRRGDWAEHLGRDVAVRGADALWPHLTAR